MSSSTLCDTYVIILIFHLSQFISFWIVGSPGEEKKLVFFLYKLTRDVNYFEITKNLAWAQIEVILNTIFHS